MPIRPFQISHFPPKILQNVLDIINLSNNNIELNTFWRQILSSLSNIVYAESSVLFLADEYKKKSPPILQNLPKDRADDYTNHFCKLDPFGLQNPTNYSKTVFLLEDIVDRYAFLNSEYYNDFYKPQKIYHKLVVNLRNNHRLYGEICLHRPPGCGNFSKEDIRKVQTVTPYVIHALEHSELRRKIHFKDKLLSIIDDKLSSGIIILDDLLKMVYINNQAKTFLKKLFGENAIPSIGSSPPAVLLDGCLKIKHHAKNNLEFAELPQNRLFQINPAQKYNITSRLIKKEFSIESNHLFVISIDPTVESKSIDIKKLKRIYRLTNRESEVAVQISKGLKNAEIAKKLFVSEITVKWHVRNIFEKLEVNTRAAFVHKAMLQSQNTDQHATPLSE